MAKNSQNRARHTKAKQKTDRRKSRKKAPPLVFVAGLPRSGSTLLMNLLAQNPAHHCTPTSGLVHTVENVIRNWNDNIVYKAEGVEKVRPKIRRLLRDGMLGFHGEHIDKGKTVFEKNRTWPLYAENLAEILGGEVYLILCCRDLRCVCSSFERLYRERNLHYRYPQLAEVYSKAFSVEGRLQILMAQDGMVGSAANITLDASRRLRNHKSVRLIRVGYQQFTHQPLQVVQKVHEIIGLRDFDYNVQNVEQKTHEDDLTFYGQDLHTLKSPEIKPQKPDWSPLTKELAEDLDKGNYKILNGFDKYEPEYEQWDEENEDELDEEEPEGLEEAEDRDIED